jgi:hypothetical protein
MQVILYRKWHSKILIVRNKKASIDIVSTQGINHLFCYSIVEDALAKLHDLEWEICSYEIVCFLNVKVFWELIPNSYKWGPYDISSKVGVLNSVAVQFITYIR